jgi:hypothetical protein
MEGLERMVSELFVRHGLEPEFDYRRVQWSRWFRCADSFSLLLVSSKPGVFALGEEIVAPEATGDKRLLGLFQLSETDDLGMALGRLFLPGSPVRDRLAAGRCFARYAVIEDPAQRHAAYAALQRWLSSTSESELGTEN